MPLAKLETRAAELMLHSRVNYAYRRMLEYREADRTWGARHAGVLRPHPVAYFSAEFGLHESLPVYSGGLGVLGRRSHQECVGSRYPSGGHWAVSMAKDIFGRGSIRTAGNGKSTLRPMSTEMPMEVAIGKDGRPVVVEIETRSGRIRAKVWRVKVGRRDLLLLDSDVEGNAPEDRELTSRLYGGDLRIRIRQELLLG